MAELTKKEHMAARVLTTFPLFMHKVFGDFHPETGAYSLNKTQFKALLIVHIEGFPHMTKVCYHMNIEKGSLTPVIDSLIDLGLVVRARNPRDRRKVNLSLTEQGHSLVRRNLRQAHDHLLDKLNKLPHEEVRRFERAVLDLHTITMQL